MLLVSGYYRIPSKQNPDFYEHHLQRFFRLLKQPILFFTNKETYERIKYFPTHNVTFEICELEDLEIFDTFDKDFWLRQISRDPEKYHTWQVGSIWANKKYFVKKAAVLDPNHTWYMWIDAGCIRKDSWAPYTERFGQRPIDLEPGVYCQLLSPLPEKVHFRYRDQYIAGGLILFHTAYIKKFIDATNTILREYDQLAISGTSDQYVMATTSLSYPWLRTICFKESLDYSIIHCPDAWFFFLAYF